MDLRANSFRCFILLAEELSFTRGAARADLTQSALSMRIRDMEQQLGVPLFHRSSRAVALTTEGAELLDQARRIVAETDRFQELCTMVRQTPEAPLQIAVPISGFGNVEWMQIINRFRALEPRVTIHLSHHASQDTILAVQDGRADIGFVAGPPSIPMPTLVMARYPLSLGVPEEWDIARKPKLHKRDLEGMKIAAFDRMLNPVFYADVLERLHACGMVLVPSPEGVIGAGFAERERIASLVFPGLNRDSAGSTFRTIPFADLEVTMPLSAVRNEAATRRPVRLLWEFIRTNSEAMVAA